MPDMSDLFDYEFSVWPAEHGWERSVYELFRSIPRISIMMGDDQFQLFRDSLGRSGFTLREGTRVPHHEPEPIR